MTGIIGNYVIDAELGRGGMGIVYAATHRVLARRAAIKVLLADTLQHRDQVERFFNEARAAMAIDHPGIVRIYDVGIAADGRAYIAMELLDGESLAHRLRRGPLPVRIALELARQIADALTAAHDAGIIHRDLKPENVIVMATGRIKLVDFGIAKLAPINAHGVRTATGAVIGTPAYMSPEQCEGARNLDGRSDLYSLGCVLFAMLTGRPPFEGETGTLIGMHLHVAPPRLRTRCAAASSALEAVVERLLSKPPAARFPHARAVTAALSSHDVLQLAASDVAVTADPIASPSPSLPYASTAATGPSPSLAAPPPPPVAAFSPTIATGAPPPAAHYHAPPAAAPPPARSRDRTIALLGLVSAAGIVIAILGARSCSSGPLTTTDAAIARSPADAGPLIASATDARTADAPSPGTLAGDSLAATVERIAREGSATSRPTGRDAGSSQRRPPTRPRPGTTPGSGSSTPAPKPVPEAGSAGSAPPPDEQLASPRPEPDTVTPPVDTTPPPPPAPRSINERLLFGHNDDAWIGDGERVLARVAALLTEHPDLRIHIIGYLDPSENPRSFAGSRANRVLIRLTSGPPGTTANKVARSRMRSSTGTTPIAGCRDQDRRCVEFVVLSP